MNCYSHYLSFSIYFNLKSIVTKRRTFYWKYFTKLFVLLIRFSVSLFFHFVANMLVYMALLPYRDVHKVCHAKGGGGSIHLFFFRPFIHFCVTGESKKCPFCVTDFMISPCPIAVIISKGKATFTRTSILNLDWKLRAKWAGIEIMFSFL